MLIEVIPMYCTKCGAQLHPETGECPTCHNPAPQLAPPVTRTTVIQELVFAAPVPDPLLLQPHTQKGLPPAVQYRKASHRLPLLILGIMCVVGLLTYFLFPSETETDLPQTPQRPDSGYAEQPTKPNAPYAPWFRADEGTVYFYDYNYTGSEELTVPDMVDGDPVRKLSDFCFYNSDQLTTVILPDSLGEIGRSAFGECSSLRGIFIPQNVKRIGAGAFAGCTELEAICLHPGIETLGDGIFENCPSLKYVFFSGTKEQWREIFGGEIPSGATVYCEDGQLTGD